MCIRDRAYPSEYNRIASFKRAPCNLLSIKPSISFFTTTIDEPESLKIALTFSIEAIDVFSPGQISTHGIRWWISRVRYQTSVLPFKVLCYF